MRNGDMLDIGRDEQADAFGLRSRIVQYVARALLDIHVAQANAEHGGTKPPFHTLKRGFPDQFAMGLKLHARLLNNIRTLYGLAAGWSW